MWASDARNGLVLPEEFQGGQVYEVYVGIIVVQDVQVGATFTSHPHGALLAQTYPVPKAPALQENLIS
jgi:hypothetical protein